MMKVNHPSHDKTGNIFRKSKKRCKSLEVMKPGVFQEWNKTQGLQGNELRKKVGDEVGKVSRARCQPQMP